MTPRSPAICGPGLTGSRLGPEDLELTSSVEQCAGHRRLSREYPSPTKKVHITRPRLKKKLKTMGARRCRVVSGEYDFPCRERRPPSSPLYIARGWPNP